MPGNFEGCSGIEASNSIRVSVPASARRWFAKNDNEYAIAKQNAGEKMKGIAIGMFPSIKSHTTGQELFTPCTVKRFTGHINGAIYGSPDKLRDGKTLMNNLRICGTDQGLLGIVGSLTSGIITANSLLI
jgi:hypothetical protein